MPLAQRITIADAVKDVLERSGFAEQGTAVLSAGARVRAFLRQAAREFYGKADWSELFKELVLPLTPGQDRYEFPDETVLGGLQLLEVLDTNDRRYPLDWAIRTHDFMPTPDESTGLRVAIGQPDRVRIIDRELQVLPAPNDNFPKIIATYKASLGPMQDEKEDMPYESELLIQRAVVLTKTHYQKPGVQQATVDFERYLKDRVAAQRGRRVFNVGGRKSHYVTRDKRVPRKGAYGSTGDGAAFGDTWNPW